ncbi:polysaccharide deacetylase family protein [Methylocaldum szegediense]|mgnify:CR=1 FL=1|uniref:Polysaccharide deacetylase n=1 Tax=Methylocaldum szegediense TaxID=73780 RepID=A0ABN8X8Z1_9GAMM|nr:polysaccharide deacetylase family protein [Methylocaldum szegediense]CAI8897571.1 Polysaccharide deacetylase [Methylocaldum szegediense]
MGDAMMATGQTDVANELSGNARPVAHWRNLLWWMVLAAVLAALRGTEYLSGESRLPAPASIGAVGENEAFIALAFGKVSSTHEFAISPALFRAQMAALKKAGYSTVGLSQIVRWRHDDEAMLPEKPLLLTFDEPHRETMETADEVFASLGMTGVVFVDPNVLDRRNTQMVSWHRLEQLVESGRWEVGVSGCRDTDIADLASAEALARRFARERDALERRLGRAVISVDCPRAWKFERRDGAEIWRQAVESASFAVGFATGPWKANYRDDPAFDFRRIRVARDWGESDLVSQLEIQAPRRKPFIDRFQSAQPAPDWMVDSGEIAIEDGMLRLSSKPGEQGALVTLAGTAHWRDARVEAELEDQGRGQFWISLRQRQGEPFVRLGVSEGEILLQARNRDGSFNRLGSRKAPTGAMTLSLRVVGSRVLAFVNGYRLLTRPAEVPEGAHYGSLMIAVWNDRGDDAAGVGASIRLKRIEAEPLPRKYGIVSAMPKAAVWTKLRREVDEMYMLSPSYFAWAGGAYKEARHRDLAVEIFARHHRLKFQPALVLEDPIQPSDAVALTEKALSWADDPAFDGLNVVMKPANVEDQQSKDFLAGLSARLAEKGKTLTVTLIGDWERDTFSFVHDNLILVQDGQTNVSVDEYTMASVP